MKKNDAFMLVKSIAIAFDLKNLQTQKNTQKNSGNVLDQNI